MTPDLLRRAIGDVEACREMTSPASEMVRAEYFSARAAVNCEASGQSSASMNGSGTVRKMNRYTLRRCAPGPSGSNAV